MRVFCGPIKGMMAFWSVHIEIIELMTNLLIFANVGHCVEI